ncbi:MAG: nucleotide exchange factor GrpE [Anaerolineaceae bacterium]|nr:MAG: nucleotide exchange factor GrpE [Anaerolineaceae bacterium]
MAKKNSNKASKGKRPEDSIPAEVIEEASAIEAELESEAEADLATQETSAVRESQAEAAPPPDSEGSDERMAELQAENERNRLGWQRTLAEFQNYKRRIEREQVQTRQKITTDVLAGLLPIIDDFDRAMANLPDELKENAWLNGVSMIQGKFMRLLEEYNVNEIEPTGEPFDPNLHQAIARGESDEVESGHIIETVQKGYICGDVVVRPALVRVAN